MTNHAALIHGEELPRKRVDAFLTANGPATPSRGAGNHATSHDEPADARRHTAAPPAERLRAERQRRRWATQVVVTDELARRACADRGLEPPMEVSPAKVLAVAEADIADLGSIVAAALAHSPAARLLLSELEAEQIVPEAAVRDYYDRNRDRFLTPEALRRGVDPFGSVAEADFVPYQAVRESCGARRGGGPSSTGWTGRAPEWSTRPGTSTPAIPRTRTTNTGTDHGEEAALVAVRNLNATRQTIDLR